MENDGARYARIKFGTSCRSIILNYFEFFLL